MCYEVVRQVSEYLRQTPQGLEWVVILKITRQKN
jgi:hypothetical protein